MKCPCGERDIHVTQPPHTIIFDAGGRLTLNGSVGMRPIPSTGLPRNWCHLRICAGKAVAYSDARCPGRDLLPVVR